MMSTFTRSIVDFFIVAFVTLCVLGVFISDVFIFRVKPSTYVDHDISHLIKLKTSEGSTISAAYYPNPKAEYTVLVSHGNAEDLGTSQHFAQELVEHGFAVLVYDYYGYGTSEGKPTEYNSYIAVETAYNYLVSEQHVPTRKIIAYGHSLGSALATYLAGHEPVGGLVIEGAFTTAFRVLTVHSMLPFDKFETDSRIGSIDIPKLIIHGTADQVIAFWHGQELYERASPPKDYLWVPKAGHSNSRIIEPKQYWEKWQSLVKTMEQFSYSN
jgi:alpha-beta hydrolase superfamily lysophospholipase